MVLLIVLCAHSCEKEKPEPALPPETQEGKNIFGCYVNDVLFLKEWSRVWGSQPLQANYTISTSRLSIWAESNNKTIGFSVLNPEVNKMITLEFAGYYMNYIYIYIWNKKFRRNFFYKVWFKQ